MNETATFSLLESVLSAGPIGLSTFVILIFASISSWAIIFYKYKNIRAATLHNEAFLERFWSARSLDEIVNESSLFARAPSAQVFQAGYQELLRIQQKKDPNHVHGSGTDNIERALRRALTHERTQLEHLSPFLATVGSTAPFIGLFGTVVGIINAFSDIAREKSASLTTVAPGIAEALVATAAGLLAAIPAVIAYNFFNTRVKILSSEMSNFASDFLNIVKRKFL